MRLVLAAQICFLVGGILLVVGTVLNIIHTMR